MEAIQDAFLHADFELALRLAREFLVNAPPEPYLNNPQAGESERSESSLTRLLCIIVQCVRRLGDDTLLLTVLSEFIYLSQVDAPVFNMVTNSALQLAQMRHYSEAQLLLESYLWPALPSTRKNDDDSHGERAKSPQEIRRARSLSRAVPDLPSVQSTIETRDGLSNEEIEIGLELYIFHVMLPMSWAPQPTPAEARRYLRTVDVLCNWLNHPSVNHLAPGVCERYAQLLEECAQASFDKDPTIIAPSPSLTDPCVSGHDHTVTPQSNHDEGHDSGSVRKTGSSARRPSRAAPTPPSPVAYPVSDAVASPAQPHPEPRPVEPRPVEGKKPASVVAMIVAPLASVWTRVETSVNSVLVSVTPPTSVPMPDGLGGEGQSGTRRPRPAGDASPSSALMLRYSAVAIFSVVLASGLYRQRGALRRISGQIARGIMTVLQLAITYDNAGTRAARNVDDLGDIV